MRREATINGRARYSRTKRGTFWLLLTYATHPEIIRTVEKLIRNDKDNPDRPHTITTPPRARCIVFKFLVSSYWFALRTKQKTTTIVSMCSNLPFMSYPGWFHSMVITPRFRYTVILFHELINGALTTLSTQVPWVSKLLYATVN